MVKQFRAIVNSMHISCNKKQFWDWTRFGDLCFAKNTIRKNLSSFGCARRLIVTGKVVVLSYLKNWLILRHLKCMFADQYKKLIISQLFALRQSKLFC